MPEIYLLAPSEVEILVVMRLPRKLAMTRLKRKAGISFINNRQAFRS